MQLGGFSASQPDRAAHVERRIEFHARAGDLRGELGRSVMREDTAAVELPPASYRDWYVITWQDAHGEQPRGDPCRRPPAIARVHQPRCSTPRLHTRHRRARRPRRGSVHRRGSAPDRERAARARDRARPSGAQPHERRRAVVGAARGPARRGARGAVARRPCRGTLLRAVETA